MSQTVASHWNINGFMVWNVEPWLDHFFFFFFSCERYPVVSWLGMLKWCLEQCYQVKSIQWFHVQIVQRFGAYRCWGTILSSDLTFEVSGGFKFTNVRQILKGGLLFGTVVSLKISSGFILADVETLSNGVSRYNHPVVSRPQMLKHHLEQWALLEMIQCNGFTLTGDDVASNSGVSLKLCSSFALTNVGTSWTVVSHSVAVFYPSASPPCTTFPDMTVDSYTVSVMEAWYLHMICVVKVLIYVGHLRIWTCPWFAKMKLPALCSESHRVTQRGKILIGHFSSALPGSPQDT